MPAEINFGMPPAGYASAPARATDQTASVQFREFTSTEDGQYFIQRLEGFPSEILGKLSFPIRASQVDHMLAICRRDGKATVYVNELEQRTSVRFARSVEAGEPVTKDDFVDVERLELGVRILDDAGVLFIFSVGWRKGLFYDFGPVGGQTVIHANTTSLPFWDEHIATFCFRNDLALPIRSGMPCSHRNGSRSQGCVIKRLPPC